MSHPYSFHTTTSLAEGFRDLLAGLESRLDLGSPLNIYLAGGMAVHLYTANRVTTDVDAEFSARIFLPADLMVKVKLEDGRDHIIHFDSNYNSTFALMHEDYINDAIPVEIGGNLIRVHVLSPVDLAVSKIARFADNDKEDIAALVRMGLTSSSEIEERALSAMDGFVGGMSMLRLNIRDAVDLAKSVEMELNNSKESELGCTVEMGDGIAHGFMAASGLAVVGAGMEIRAAIAEDDARKKAAMSDELVNLKNARISALPVLKDSSGVARVFWEKSCLAIAEQGVDGVDWLGVSRSVATEAIIQKGVRPADVAKVLFSISPVAVTEDGKSSLLRVIDLAADDARSLGVRQYKKDSDLEM